MKKSVKIQEQLKLSLSLVTLCSAHLTHIFSLVLAYPECVTLNSVRNVIFRICVSANSDYVEVGGVDGNGLQLAAVSSMACKVLLGVVASTEIDTKD